MKLLCCKNFNIINIGDIGVSKPLNKKMLIDHVELRLVVWKQIIFNIMGKIVLSKHTESIKPISLKNSSFEPKHTCAHTIYRNIIYEYA